MDCEQLQLVLDDYLSGSLADDAAVRDHLNGCAGCRDLVRILRDDLAVPPVPAPAGLAEAVLARTSGPACDTAREAVPGAVDGDLNAEDAGLLDMHLAGCSDCRSLASAIRMLAADLPAMAEMEPAAGFTAQVLAATSEKASLAERFTAALHALARRPRIAFETAYVAAVVLTLLVGLPFGGELSAKMQDLAGMRPVQTLVAVDGPVGGAVHDTVAYAGRVGSETVRNTKERVVNRAQGVTGWLREYGEGLKQRWTGDPLPPDRPEPNKTTEETEP